MDALKHPVIQAESCGIEVYVNAPTSVRHAAHQLSDYTGIPIETGSGSQGSIRIRPNETANPGIDKQGYTIRSRGRSITISGNGEDGVTNGVFTLLRTLMIEHCKDPFSRSWNIEEKPQFTTRAMLVSPYRFGASYGFAKLSPDRWSFEDWKEYVDLMRLTNMTTLTMGSERVYHPDYPDSQREKWRFEVWKQVMDYCHQIGMKFNWFIAPNLVTEQAFWDNPDKRADQFTMYKNNAGSSWYGNGLSWKRGKDLILENQKYTLEYFRGLDALEIIYSDGGGFSFDDPDPAEYFADATRSYQKLMRDVGNDADFVYWNWILDFWAKILLPKDVLERHPRYETMQDDIIPLLPKNVTWLDSSMLTLIHAGAKFIQDSGNPPLRETVMLGKEHGFKSVIDFFWYMNPEHSLNMFPHPYIGRTIQEARYAYDEMGVDGVMGYRLAPPCRFIDDYVFFRLASDPSLTVEQLIEEVAGLLTENPENRAHVKEGVSRLEQFWTTHDVGHLEKAEELFRTSLATESNKQLEYVSNGLTFLTHVIRMAQPDAPADEKEQTIRELYTIAKEMYIFQGLVADIVWASEAYDYFKARVEMMVDHYNNSGYHKGNPYTETIDRSIYPKATTELFRLRWPDSGQI